MTVKELIEHLKKCDGNAIVVQSQDGEGNGYSPVAEVDVGVYQAVKTWYGDFHGADCLGDANYSQPDPEQSVPAVCLWPTN